MRGRFGYLVVIAAGLSLLALASCNNGDSSGGTTETTTGYSAANLAGTWTGSMSCQPNPCYFTISFDAGGRVAHFDWVPTVPATGGMSGTVKVDATGRLSGQTITVWNGAQSEKFDWRKLKFRSADMISGIWQLWEIPNPNATWDPFNMSMTRQ